MPDCIFQNDKIVVTPVGSNYTNVTQKFLIYFRFMFFTGLLKFLFLMPCFWCTRRKTNFREMFINKRGIFYTICINTVFWLLTLVAELVVTIVATVWRFNKAGLKCVGSRNVIFRKKWDTNGP